MTVLEIAAVVDYSTEIDFLKEKERYFEDTIEIINKRKTLGKKKIYQDMMI